MSRRITVFVLAASAALTATQARADREWFENSCHLPQVVEPAATPVAAADSQASADTSARKVAAASAPEPPRMPELSPAKIAAPREAVAPAPTYPRGNATPVREMAPVREAAPRRVVTPDYPNHSLPAPARAAERAYARENRSTGSLIINVPAASYGAEGVAPVQPFALYMDNHAPRFYVLAPGAKIISIDDGN
jgi:hypothetical protein